MQEVDHVPAYIAVFTAGEVAVVAGLKVDAQLPGDFKLHVVQSAFGLGHVDPAAGIAARLIHCFSPPSFKVVAIVTLRSEKYAGILFKSTGCAERFFFCEKTRRTDAAEKKHHYTFHFNRTPFLSALLTFPAYYATIRSRKTAEQ
ncbi:MAG: hypothetical protein IKH57_22375 [Clostridia bacterium]|nr:hypothetical protein [Clostridia bacterium]